jgi:isopentenyl-diphosphate delta-isomerase
MKHSAAASDLTHIPAWVDGVLTPVEKLEAHQRGLRHKAVSVFVMRGDEILLQQRALEKYHTPGLWTNTCCTHPHWDETGEDCAYRRLQEELGISGVSLNYREQVEYRADVGGGLIEHELVDIFVGTATDDMPLALNADEVMNTRWVPLADLRKDIAASPELFTPWMKIYLDTHSDQIFGK